MDGTCNNLVHPEFGVAMKPFRRLMPPAYGDGKFLFLLLFNMEITSAKKALKQYYFFIGTQFIFSCNQIKIVLHINQVRLSRNF